MLLLSCPNCGPRNVSEFGFGGETTARPRPDQPLSNAEWSDYLYTRHNRLGIQPEWWYHRAGCRLWFLAERHTQTNEVLATYRWGESAR